MEYQPCWLSAAASVDRPEAIFREIHKGLDGGACGGEKDVAVIASGGAGDVVGGGPFGRNAWVLGDVYSSEAGKRDVRH